MLRKLITCVTNVFRTGEVVEHRKASCIRLLEEIYMQDNLLQNSIQEQLANMFKEVL